MTSFEEQLRKDVAALSAELAGLRERIGRTLKRLEKETAEARFLAEASLMSKLNHRAPTPEEVATMSDAAIAHLARQLGLPANAPKAVILDQLAERMGWAGWQDEGD